MGLFGSGPVLEHPELAELLVTADKSRKADTKVLAKNESAIANELSQGEDPLVVAADWNSASGGVIVVTDRRSLLFRKGRVDRQLRHDEVHSTTIGTMPSGDMLVHIQSETAMLDYAPNDAARYKHIIQVRVGTPRAAQMICAAVDARL